MFFEFGGWRLKSLEYFLSVDLIVDITLHGAQGFAEHLEMKPVHP